MRHELHICEQLNMKMKSIYPAVVVPGCQSVKLLIVHRYIVDIFSCFGPLGILGSDSKQNTT